MHFSVAIAYFIFGPTSVQSTIIKTTFIKNDTGLIDFLHRPYWNQHMHDEVVWWQQRTLSGTLERTSFLLYARHPSNKHPYRICWLTHRSVGC